MKKIVLIPVCVLILLSAGLAYAQIKNKLDIRIGNSDQFYIVTAGNYSGIVNGKDQIVVDLIYDYLVETNENLVVVELNGKRGFIDKNWKEIVPPEYSLYEFANGLALVSKEGKYGFVNNKGVFKVPLKYDWADDFSNGMAAVEINDKYGFIDSTGAEVITPKFLNVMPFSDGMAAVKIKDYLGIY